MTKAHFDACFMGLILNIMKIVPQASFCGITFVLSGIKCSKCSILSLNQELFMTFLLLLTPDSWPMLELSIKMISLI